MKRILYLAIATTIILSCKKDEIKTSPLTSINITNAVVGGTTAKLGSNATNISNNSYAQMAVVAGTNSLYVYPVGDSAHPYYTNDKFTSNDREVYSLFLGGTPTATDAIMVKETIPYRTDSTAGIRFINLANNNGALNITLSTTPTVNEVSALAYKSLTEFKTYPGLYNSAPTFQVRKADGTLLTSFAFTTSTIPRFANVTLVIRPNGTGVSVFRVNNDR
jgi:hypothetical protein